MNSTQMRKVIERKREGEPLEPSVWADTMRGFINGAIDEAQMAALAMACVLRGMTVGETVALTQALIDSGETLDLGIDRMVVDKHSSGGVGDTVSLVLVPMVAACGVPVAKLSGRALGHTGGTLDKLEAIPGVRTDLTPEEFSSTVRTVGCAITAQSRRLVPADARLYALRDRTGTVPSAGLIAASIVSKKIAGGADAIVFDVKVGSGAFMRDLQSGRSLAKTLVDVTRQLGRRASAIVSDMNEPLSPAIGAGIEAIEARRFLSGEGRDPRLLDVALELGAEMLALCGIERGGDALKQSLGNGSAFEKFCDMLTAQGADLAAFLRLEVPSSATPVEAQKAGFVSAIDSITLGESARALSRCYGSLAGIRMHVRIGQHVERGQPLATLYGASAEPAESIVAAVTIAERPAVPGPLILARVE